jgi:hypothetical protein
MIRLLTLSCLTLILAVPASADQLTGKYVEARTCDVWTGPCFANADFNIAGKNAVMAWQVDRGTLNGVNLDGLGIVAVVSASDTLGLEQTGPAKVVLIVDTNATTQQRDALIQMVRQHSGKLLDNVVAVQSADVSVNICVECKGSVCADVTAGTAKVKTRCLDAHHDKVCGNESAYYPPLVSNANALPAAVEEHVFTGTGLGATWSDFERRGAYVGSFAIR